jgi:hypothetical protein
MILRSALQRKVQVPGVDSTNASFGAAVVEIQPMDGRSDARCARSEQATIEFVEVAIMDDRTAMKQRSRTIAHLRVGPLQPPVQGSRGRPANRDDPQA